MGSAAASGRRGLVDRIASKAAALISSLTHEGHSGPRRAVTGVSIMGVGIQTERVPIPVPDENGKPDLEATLASLGDLLAERGTGLLLTIDELHVSEIDEIREFGNVFQTSSRRQERPIAFVGAALPELEERLLSGDASTFLQRCRRHEIGNLRPSETAAALRRPIELAGTRIEDDALTIAVDASEGRPYLVQLIGYHAWDDTEDLERGISVAEIRRAVDDAIEQYGQHVHGPVWYRLSDLDKRFLAAMLTDPETSTIADIGSRWGHNPRSVSTYRKRLMSAGLIFSVGRGRVAFVDPSARRFVAARAAAEGFSDPAEPNHNRTDPTTG
ncbi:MAG: hypothetical protein F4176_10850 [Acidimicrobiia bacterium]|nr:hypothetical protein [Acidimicrobiia bacterium]